MAALTPVQVTRAGITDTLVACAGGGDTYDNSKKPYIEINNASVSSITLYAALHADGQTIVQGRSWVIGAGLRVKIAPMTGEYNDTDGKVSLTYSGVTTLTIGLFF